ncbi:exodeoxyribonuclease V subunit beta [Dyella subtropica]|uniref:exodeoxyribonuclease V subunit beta n=1 Tax=Dyella subtropica TaxID=2992127 RepID=UPI002257B62B|nr:exodeoxyribonuclease V subunit beta [Dyella subtropica]
MSTTAPLAPLRLPLHGVQLIEASAGTGKTWTIAALYLRLVLGHGTRAPLLPAQILVLTFTKAATAELRDRIRARLSEAASVFRGSGTPDDFLAALMAEYPDEHARAMAARQLELAAQWMDEAAVHTIHGWSQRMLGQHAFDSGHPFVQDTETDESELLAEAVRDYWRLQCLTLDRDGAALIGRWWQTPQALQRTLKPLLRQPASSLRLHGRPLPEVAGVHAALQAPLHRTQQAQTRARTLWIEELAVIEVSLREATRQRALNGRSYPPDRLPDDLAAMHEWAHGAGIDEAVLRRYTQTKLSASANKNQTAPVHAAFAAIDDVIETFGALDQVKPRVLAHAAPWVAARLDQSKRLRAQLGFDDMLTRLDDALHGPSGERLANTIAVQYPFALIDEFQDTDPLQWQIFRRIYAQRTETGLLLIGDPKQAIYGFRGADIHTYLQARTTASQPTWTLATNYRSTTTLVHAVNRVFAHADTHPEGAFGFGQGERGLPFQPVQARGRDDRLVLDGAPLPALQLAVLDDAQSVGSTAYRQRMAEQSAAWLVQLLDAAQTNRCGFQAENQPLVPLKPGDIAILVRSGKEAATMRSALQQRGLKSVYLSDRDSVHASPEAADLLLWLKACAEPGSDRAMRAALATPSIGQSYAELDRLNTDERYWEQCGERFRRFHDTWLRHGVLAMLHDLLHAFDLPSRWLARDDGERALTNLLHLAELLQQAATALDGEHALIRHLSEQIADAHDGQADTAEEQIVRLESEAELIKVVTIHKSKGLEYPLVLLPFACSLRELRRSDSFVWHDANGTPHMDLQPDEQAWSQAERERLQEDLRLLYVALTRPRYACWLGVACVKVGNEKASSLHKSAFGYLLSGGKPIEPVDLMPALHALRGEETEIRIEQLPETPEPGTYRPTAPETTGLQPARHYAGQPNERWWIASYSALRYGEADDSSAPAAPETPTQDRLAEASVEQAEPVTPPISTAGIHAFPRGAMPGTFLHDLLEWAAEEGFASVADDPASAREQIARRCQRHHWQDQVELLSQWLPALLRMPLPLTDGRRLALADLRNTASYRAELEFWFAVHRVDTLALDRLVTTNTLDGRARLPLLPDRLNGMLKGFVDLLFEHDGRYYVVDYKSNWLGSDASAYTTEAMRDSVLRERYDLQYAIYTLALHRQLRVRLPDYDYERHIGGVLYLYLRGVDAQGHGIHREHLPLSLIEAMDVLFSEGAHADAA